MATNVYIKHNNERSIEELNYIEELKKICDEKLNFIKNEENKIIELELLRNKFETIHQNLNYDIAVPISENSDTKIPLCLIEGKLIHTNEVFMPIGTSYYTKISTAEAIAHCSRKIEDTKELIEELKEDRRPVVEKLVFLEASRTQEGQVEIIEEYDDATPEARSRRDSRGVRLAPKYSHGTSKT